MAGATTTYKHTATFFENDQLPLISCQENRYPRIVRSRYIDHIAVGDKVFPLAIEFRTENPIRIDLIQFLSFHHAHHLVLSYEWVESLDMDELHDFIVEMYIY